MAPAERGMLRRLCGACGRPVGADSGWRTVLLGDGRRVPSCRRCWQAAVRDDLDRIDRLIPGVGR